MKNSTTKIALFLIVAVLGHLSNLAAGGLVTELDGVPGEGEASNLPQGASISYCTDQARAFVDDVRWGCSDTNYMEDTFQLNCMTLLESGYNKGYRKGKSECGVSGEGEASNLPQGAISYCTDEAGVFAHDVEFECQHSNFIEQAFQENCETVLESGYNKDKGYQKGKSECTHFETNEASTAKFVRG